ncbi:MAG TPA: hypothetical protein VKQ36_04805 [Ktedonobacterales bacterium]|nr:hypothetical protein [Ktedonobacterales bacterium]
MGVLRVLSHHGDDRIAWDQTSAERGDLDAQAAIREAERIFAEQRMRGATAVKVAPGRPAERIERFDPNAEEIVMIPRVVGG